jgi:FG-GAP-like repeat/IPT/TIG domain/FG-GAP repeat
MRRLYLLALILAALSTYGQAPVITSLSAASGPVGSTLIINGSNFSATAANNTVYFGGVKATIATATTTALTVTVPDGATPQPVSVTTNHLTAYSKSVFNTSFSGGSAGFVPSSFGDTNLTTGLYPYAVCATDIDGDGKPDLISPGNANSPTSIISYRRNTSSAGTVSFAPEVDLPAPSGSYPYSMVTADLDGDGRQDVVFTASTGSLSIYPNSSTAGTIAFASRQDFTTGTDPFSVAVADLDGDGKPDIVVANFLSNSISIYRNISTPGSIAFAPRIDLTTALAPHTVAIADLDGDGKPDIAVTDAFSSEISLFRNQSTPGTLTFATRVDIATGPDEPSGLAIGDLDGDGKPDLVVTYDNFNETTQASVSFSLLHNNSSPGSFAFSAPSNYGTGDTYNPAIGDLNGDGKPDLAIPTSSNYVYVYPNTSSPGTVEVGAPGKYYDLGSYAIAISDLDGDNQPDMAVANFTTNTIAFLKNTTTAPGITFVTPTTAITGTTVTIVGVNLGTVTAVSFGGVPAASFTIVSPATITAVVGAGATGNITITATNGTASFPGFTYTIPGVITAISPAAAGAGATITIHGANLGDATAVSFGGSPAASFTIVADTVITAVVNIGATGDVDVVTPGNTAILPDAFVFVPLPVITGFSPTTAARGATITITGTNLTAATAVTLGGTPAVSFTVNSPTSITAVVGGGSTGTIAVTTLGGTATQSGFTYIAQPPPTLTSFTPTSGKIGTPVTLTGTGFDPVTTNDVVYFGAVRATVNAASATTINVTVPAGASLQPISVTTLGNNLAAYSAKPFGVTFDSGALQFAYPVTYQLGDYNHNIAAGDLDGDGKADLIICTDNEYFADPSNPTTLLATTFVIMKNTTTKVGSIAFTSQELIAGAYGHYAAVVTDVDGDGKPDLVILGYDSVHVLRNTSIPGTISFDTAISFLTGNFGKDLAVADLDGDGRPELITVNSSFASSISVLRNTCIPGTISFAAKTDYPAGNNPSGVAIGDFDGDGKKDLAISSYNDNTVVIFRNQSAPGVVQLSAPVTLNVGANPSGIQAGDFDGDNKPDIATSNYSDNTISVIKNQSVPGSLAFATAAAYSNNYVVQALSIRLAIADMDGDGKLDLQLINQAYPPGDASGFKNISTPGNLAFQNAAGGIINGVPAGVVMQDFDEDGRPDMATCNSPVWQGVSILRNQSGEQPVITSFTPTAGNDTTTITIKGKNFDSTTAVSFAGIPAISYTIVSDSVITAVPPANSSGIVSVTAPEGTGSLAGFVYAAPPIVNQATPINATTGETVTLNGYNFLAATSVSFGGIPAASFTVVNSTTITTVVAAGASGGIAVTTPYGSDTLGGFTYWPVPTITSFTPIAGGPGTVVTITGTNFGDATNVQFGGVGATTFTINSPTQITAIVGTGASGNVGVTNDGWSNILAGFVFDPSAQITANGSTTFCQGDSVVLQSAIASGNQWNENGTPIAGATADTLLVTTSGSYTVQLNFPNLTNPTSSPTSVTVNPIPATPTINAATNGGLTSSAASGNQWYADSTTSIPGANGQLYTPADSGYYTVQVSTAGCASAMSAPYFYHLPAKPTDTTAAPGMIVVQPNPTTGGRTQVNYTFPGVSLVVAELSDMQGRTLLLQTDFASGTFIDLANLPKGVYFLRLRDANGKTYGKISILKMK